MSHSYAQSARALQEPRPPQGAPRTRAVSSAEGAPRSYSKPGRNPNNSLQLPPVVSSFSTSPTMGFGSPAASAVGAADSITGAPRPRIALRPLTKLEQQRMDTIPQRQKENRHQPQIVRGKAYEGSGFAASPTVVSFVDFEVGREYRQTIKLTNISYTFNSFKVEALPVEVRAVLDVVYAPQSRMVAGRDCTIDVIFTPKENVDIRSAITITTVTGVLDLPVECLQKRSDVTIIGGINEMDFGRVVIGESAGRTITFRNHGALPAKMTVEGDAIELFEIKHTADDGLMTTCGVVSSRGRSLGLASAGEILPPASRQGADADESDDILGDNVNNGNNNNGLTFADLNGAATTIRPRPGTAATDASVATEVVASVRAVTAATGRGGGHGQWVKPFTSVPDLSGTLSSGKQPILVLAPFSEQSFTLTFSPRETCHFETSFFFSFDSADVEDKVVFVRGEAIALPIFISENRRINFQCAFYDTLYRDSFTVSNTSTSASKVTPLVPPLLRNSLEFVPKFGFIQAGGSLTFQVKFTPDPSFAASYVTSRDGSVAFDQAIRVDVSGQTLPLYLSLVARLSHKQIRITQPSNGELSLGNIYNSEAVEAQVVLTNSASVARKVGFVNLPSNVTLTNPPVPVFSILPGESLPISLSISVPGGGVGQFTQVLRLMTEHSDACSLTITGQGRSAPVEVSPSFVAFPPAAIGSSSEAYATLTSKSAVPQDFNFMTLARHGVVVHPDRGTISPGEQIPIVLTFRADVNVVDLKLPPLLRLLDVDGDHNNVDDANSQRVSISDATKGPGIPKPTTATSAPNGATAGKKKGGKQQDDESERLLQKARSDEAKRAAFEALQKERDEEVIAIRKLIPWESSAPEEPWALHRQLIIPCSIRPTPTSSVFFTANGSSAVDLIASSSAHQVKSARPLFITARCCVVKPVATIETVNGPSVEKLSANNNLSGGNNNAPQTTAQSGGGKAANAKTNSASLQAKSTADGNVSSSGKGKEKGPLLLSPNSSSIREKDDAPATTRLENSERGLADDSGTIQSFTPTTTLDFGNIPSQQTVKKSLLIRHTHTNPNTAMILHCHPLDPYGAYTIIRPPQQILRSVGDSTEVIIKFQPTQEALYEQTLRIACEIVLVENTMMNNENGSPLGGGGDSRAQLNASSLTTGSSASAALIHLGSPTQKFSAPISRHYIVAHLTGRGQPAALTITRSRQGDAASVTGGANSSAHHGAPPSGSGQQQQTSRVGGNAGVASPARGSGAPTAGTGGSPLLGGGASSEQDVFSDISTAHEKLDQLHATLRGQPTRLVVDMGTCVAGDVLERRYDFTNCSEFPLTVRTDILQILNRNPNHQSPFFVTPSHVTIPPRISVTVSLGFHPTVEGLFGALAKVRFGGEDSFHEISLSGRATDKGLFVITPHNRNANAVLCSNAVIGTIGGPSGISVSSVQTTNTNHDKHSSSPLVPAAQNPFAAFGGEEDSANQSSTRPPPLPSATAGLVTRRDGLGALLSLLPSAAVAAPGSDAMHPLTLNFSTTAVRTFDADANAEGSPTSSPQKGANAASERERKKAEERRLKKEQKEAAAQAAAVAAAASSSVPASGSNTARSANGGRTPRQLAQAQARREDDGPGLSCTISSTTATHQIVIGNNRSSTQGEFVIEGLTETDVSHGWKVSIVSVATDDGAELVSSGGATGAGASPLAGGGVGVLGVGALGLGTGGGANANTSTSSGGAAAGASPSGAKGSAAVPPPLPVIPTPGAIPPMRGTLLPGVSALVHVTFTPLQALIESLPLDGVDIISLADLRISVRGGTPATAPEGRVLHLQLKGVVKNGSK